MKNTLYVAQRCAFTHHASNFLFATEIILCEHKIFNLFVIAWQRGRGRVQCEKQVSGSPIAESLSILEKLMSARHLLVHKSGG